MENIYQAINNVMKDVGAVGKNKTNPQQKYMYRGIDDVMSALAPAMQEHGIFAVPEVLEQIREERAGKNSRLLYSIVKVKYTFCALDGSSVQTVTYGEGMDSGDKATNKAMSAAFKYALLQTFCIPTEELIDSETDSPEVQNRQDTNQNRQNNQRSQQNNRQQRPQGRFLTFEEAEQFSNDVKRAGGSMAQICGMYGIKDLSEMTVDMANETIAALNRQ